MIISIIEKYISLKDINSLKDYKTFLKGAKTPTEAVVILENKGMLVSSEILEQMELDFKEISIKKR